MLPEGPGVDGLELQAYIEQTRGAKAKRRTYTGSVQDHSSTRSSTVSRRSGGVELSTVRLGGVASTGVSTVFCRFLLGADVDESESEAGASQRY